jgi:hypothetical protein
MVHAPRLRAFRFAILLAVSLAGCSSHDQASGSRGGAAVGLAARAPAPMAAPAAEATEAFRVPRSETLAYEHHIFVEVTKEVLPTRMQEIQSACISNKDLACSMLDYSIRNDDGVPSGTVRMRLAPSGVDPMIAIAAKGGEIASRNTHAEDLAEPIADTDRQLALLTTHRDRLAEFMKSRDIKVEQLIVVSKELASTQAQIDALGTQRANLRRRVDTELLTINLSLPSHASAAQQSPILDAFRSFGSEFRYAVANVIRFFAVLVPWLVVIVPGLIFVRFLWRWIGRWLSRRELQRPA